MKDVSEASDVVRFGMAGIAIALGVLFVVGIAHATREVGHTPDRRRRWIVMAAIGVVAWMGLTAAAARAGVLADFDRRPPPLMLLMVGVLTVGIAVGASRVGAVLAAGLPTAALVGLQAFRFPLEMVMQKAAREEIMPMQMSFEGRNWDILTGVSALVVAFLAHRGHAPRWLLTAWNVMGFGLLVNIGAVAIAATPVFGAFGDDALNTWVAHFPYVWLPAVMVATALAGHIVVFRHLRRT